MSLSRIYQGRANALEILGLPERQEFDSKALSGFDSPLWNHHVIFQTAVNYYHLCLVALAGPDENRPLSKMKVRVKEAWDLDEGKEENSWRKQLSAWLGIPVEIPFELAVAKVLEGNDTAERARELAGELLLSKIAGDIQQAGRGYWPRFSDPKANPTYDFSAAARASASGLARLAAVIHAEEVSEDELRQIASEMDLSWTVKVQPNKYFTGEEARVRMMEAVDHFLKLAEAPPARLAEVLGAFPAGIEEWASVREKIGQFPDDFQVPRNRKASPDLTFATLLFQQFPSAFTAAVLRLSVGKPKAAQSSKPAKKVSARRKAGAVTEAPVVKDIEIDFGELGDDPIKLARGARGYVFPAFTSLGRWAVPGSALPAWKEFDIAAFKEALKTVNQFGIKTVERNSLLAEAKRRLDYMNEKKSEESEWKVGDSDEPGHVPPRLKTDPNFMLIQELLDQHGISNRATGDEHVSRGVYSAGLRGFYAVKKDWTELWERKAEKNQPPPTEQELQDIVTDYQRDHLHDVGDVQLFRAMCQKRFWPLWVPEEKEEGRAKDMISAYRQYLELRDDVERLAQPIRFTPAHPERSRRLFMFSDISGSHGAEFGADGRSVTVSIAYEVEGRLQPVRAKVSFSAPRVARDEITSLSGGPESMRWLQPMMKALGCPEPKMPELEKCAVSLMPDVPIGSGVRSVRLLLNFPATLEPDGLIRHLGKQSLWYKQFNGTYKPRTQQLDTGLSLYWPGMEKAPEDAEPTAWWNQEQVRQDGITILSVDLGQRDAGAWALLETRSDGEFSRGKKAFIDLGEAGGKTWSTALQGLGMMRLPGEDARTGTPDENGKRTVESHGKAGRNATEAEWIEAGEIAVALSGDDARLRLGPHHTAWSHPEQNGELLRLVSRAQSRLSRFHRWSCRFSEEKQPRIEATIDDILDYGEVDAELTRLAKELRETVCSHAVRHGIEIEGKTKQPLSVAEIRKSMDSQPLIVAELTALLEPKVGAIQSRLALLIPDLQKVLKDSLEKIANRELPLRGRDWIWNTDRGLLEQGNYTDATARRWIRGQRGLSMDRIEQIENLRKRFMALKRQMLLVPGVPADAGVEDKGKRMEEPCEVILKKLDRLKQQRVNQTAHLILAQALGLRLRPHREAGDARREKDIHGEYEPIPHRKPVDFIVLEDLSRYLSSQGRAPSENRRLMKWCHRAVLGKLKQMCEPFGIPVLEVPAAYSSRFCALTGVPGFRAVEVHDGHANDFRWKRLINKAAKDKASKDAEAAAILFDQLRQLNVEVREARDAGESRHLRTLLAPVAGGPIFVPMSGGGPRQADMNAAINLGLRALASPGCIRARPKIRAELVSGRHQAVMGNKIEKAAGVVLSPPGSPTKELASQKRANYFLDIKRLAKKDAGEVVVNGQHFSVSGGMMFWKAIKDGCWRRVAALNAARFKKWGIEPPFLWEEAIEQSGIDDDLRFDN